jgi:hypothetical protein
MYDHHYIKVRTIAHPPNPRPTLTERNAAVLDANIECHAIGCEKQATRWTHLCTDHELWMMSRALASPFGEVNKSQHLLAKSILRSSLSVPDATVKDWTYRFWAGLRSEAIARPVNLGIDHERIGDRHRMWLYRFLTEGPEYRRKNKAHPLNLLGLFLSYEAFILPKVPSIIRGSFVSPYVSRAMFGPWEKKWFPEQKLIRAMRRADLRHTGNLILKHSSPLFLAPGGRKSGEWRDMSDALFVEYFRDKPDELDVWSSS